MTFTFKTSSEKEYKVKNLRILYRGSKKTMAIIIPRKCFKKRILIPINALEDPILTLEIYDYVIDKIGPLKYESVYKKHIARTWKSVIITM